MDADARLRSGSGGDGLVQVRQQQQQHPGPQPVSALPSQAAFPGANPSYSASPHNNFIYGNNGDFAGLQSSQYQPSDLFNPSELSWASSAASPQHLPAHSFPPSADAFRHFNGSDHNPYSAPLQVPPQQQAYADQFAGAAHSSTIAPSQLGDAQFLQQQLQQQNDSTIAPTHVWSDFSSVSSATTLSQAASNPASSVNRRTEQQPISHQTPEVASADKAVIQGCPWIRIVNIADADRSLLDAITQFGIAVDEPSAPTVTKRPKTSTATSSPKDSPVPTKPAQLAAPPKPKIPTDPVLRMRYLISECLDIDDYAEYDEIRLNVNKLWSLLSEIQSHQTELVATAVRTILKNSDAVLLEDIGKIVHFSIRVRKWVVHEFNTNKKSTMVYNMLRLFSKFKASLEIYEQTQWGKVLKKVEEKAEFQKSREIAAEILRVYGQLEKAQKAKAGPKSAVSTATAPAAARTNGEKDRAGDSGGIKREPGSNGGVKRKSEDDKTSAAASGAKRLAVGEGRNAVNSSKSNGSSGPATKNPALSVSDKKLSKNTGPSVASVAVATDPTKAKTSSFLKSLQSKSGDTAKPQAKPPEKKPATVPPPSTSSFTSIFDQLKQRQKQEQDREKALANKGNESDSKKSDEDKKKKKKSVRWKTGDELAKVKVIEWIEPEGDYYGGGNGGDHDWESARSFDVEEGREALAALKNRNFLDEEDDFIDWYQPQPIDFTVFLQNCPNAAGYPERRGGNEAIETDESKAQVERERTTLAAFYTSAREIPHSPKEPDSENDGSKEPEKTPTEIPLPDDMKQWGAPAQPPVQQPMAPQANDLSSLLSSLQQRPPTQPAQPAQPASNIFAQLQASLGIPASQPTTQAAPQPQPIPQVDLTSLLSAVAQFNPGAQQQQQQQQQQQPPQQQSASYLQAYMQQQSQAQPGQQPNTQVADLLARLTSGLTQNTSAGFNPSLLSTAGAQNPLAAWAAFNTQNQPSFSGQEPARDDTKNGRDIRRELREQAGWSDKEQPLPPPSGNPGGDGSGGGGGSRGSKWEKKHKKKADKKAKQQQNQQQGNPNVPCIFFQKGTCRHGDSCRFSHSTGGGAGGGSGGGKRKHGGRGVEAGLGAGAATGGWPTPGEMEY